MGYVIRTISELVPRHPTGKLLANKPEQPTVIKWRYAALDDGNHSANLYCRTPTGTSHVRTACKPSRPRRRLPSEDDMHDHMHDHPNLTGVTRPRHLDRTNSQEIMQITAKELALL